MSGNALTEPTRRRLTARQADTVRRLTDAAVAEVTESGYENFTVRDVARRAEVGAATAYTYFASKDHLLAEIYWRRLRALPDVDTSEASALTCVITALRELALVASGEPELAAACTAALFGTDPDVQALRLNIGMEVRRRIEAAAGPGNPLAGVLELAFFGAMVQAGLGYTTYGRVADRLAGVAELIMQ